MPAMETDDRDGLLEKLRQCLSPHQHILEAYLFGSHGRRAAKPHSDIDVAVFLDTESLPQSPFGYVADLTTALAKALRCDNVDVVILNDAPPLLYHRVLRDGVRLLARDAAATTTREGRALSRYCDYVPQLRKIDAAHAARIAAGNFGR